MEKRIIINEYQFQIRFGYVNEYGRVGSFGFIQFCFRQCCSFGVQQQFYLLILYCRSVEDKCIYLRVVVDYIYLWFFMELLFIYLYFLVSVVYLKEDSLFIRCLNIQYISGFVDFGGLV